MRKLARIFLPFIIVCVITFFFYDMTLASPLYQATTTPTRDVRTPPGSPTPGGALGVDMFPTATSISVACAPDGLITNWGTLTPDPSWLMICGSCLASATPYATIGAGFPQPSASPTYCEQFPSTEGCNTATPLATATLAGTATATSTPLTICQPPSTATRLATATVQSTRTNQPTATYSYTADITYEDTDGTWTYSGSGWVGGAGCSCTADLHTYQNNTNGTYAQIANITTDRITVYYVKGTNRGIIDVFIDGNLVGTFDGYNSTTVVGSTTFDVALGTHTVKLQVTTNKNASSSGYYLVFDKIVKRTVSNTATPIPTATIQATATAVVGFVDCESTGTGYTCLQDDSNYAKLLFNGNSPGAGGDRNVQFNLTPNVSQQITYRITVIHNEISNFSANNVADLIQIETSTGDDFNVCEVISGDGKNVTANVTCFGYKTVRTSGSNNNLVFHLGAQSDWPITGGSLYYLVEVWSYVQCDLIPVTATPGATATPGSYCQSLPETVDYTQMFDIMETGRVTSCTDLPYFSAIDLLGGLYAFISWALPDSVDNFIESIYFPASTICFYSVEFQVVNILGVTVSLSIFIDLAILLYIVRHFISK